jgi:hypothetical protein
MSKKNPTNKPTGYRFKFKHVVFVLVILIVTQILISVYQKSSLHNFLLKTQKWYQQDSAERLANLTATSLELIVDNVNSFKGIDKEEKSKIVQSFNIIFSQQLLQQNVREICLIFKREDGSLIAIDNGPRLFAFFSEINNSEPVEKFHFDALKKFEKVESQLRNSEQIYSQLNNDETFSIFVPFVPKGEFIGALYMKSRPDLSFITTELISSFDTSSIIYSTIILMGLLAIYLITSYSLKERDRVQALFFTEREQHIKEQVIHEKESHFTKRIYQAHHKAEKVMGFIKEDLKKISDPANDEIKFRVLKYSNFVSRVIYNMKWFETPLKTLRSKTFKTDINEVLRFIVNNIFLRITSRSEMFNFDLQLDENIPIIHINEFAVWEVVEPLIQNSIDHSNDNKIMITIKSEYISAHGITRIIICDDGSGIHPDLLEVDKNGIKKLFLESVTSKQKEDNRGFGCYIAYEICKRCNWSINAYNLDANGSCFEIVIPNQL